MKKEVGEGSAVFRLSKGEFEISGSESFVTEQLKELKPSIEHCLIQLANGFSQGIESNHNKPQKLLTSNAQTPNAIPSTHSSKMEDLEYVEVPQGELYEDVLVIENNKIQIIVDVPGESIAKRMINLILLYLWGKLQLGIEETSFTELREMCENYGEIDGANFSKHMNTHKKYFLIEGSGKSQSARLIRPGIKEAERIMSALNNNR